VQIISGIVLATHYVPSVDLAFASVHRIKRDVSFGWLIRNIHRSRHRRQLLFGNRGSDVTGGQP
jgi:hypothetical protein